MSKLEISNVHFWVLRVWVNVRVQGFGFSLGVQGFRVEGLGLLSY